MKPAIHPLLIMIAMTRPAVILARKITENTYVIKCQEISCIDSNSCPPWSFCNTHSRTCDPCNVCKYGSDVLDPPFNCKHPTECVNSLDSSQHYSCPRLQIVEGYPCSGICSPCSGTYGSYLGTTCRVECDDDFREVFSCIFMNEMAQWNMTTVKPIGITWSLSTTPKSQFNTSVNISPEASKHHGYPAASLDPDRGMLMGVVIGTVMGVGVALVMLWVVCHFKHTKPPITPTHSLPEEEHRPSEPLLKSNPCRPRENRQAIPEGVATHRLGTAAVDEVNHIEEHSHQKHCCVDAGRRVAEQVSDISYTVHYDDHQIKVPVEHECSTSGIGSETGQHQAQEHDECEDGIFQGSYSETNSIMREISLHSDPGLFVVRNGMQPHTQQLLVAMQPLFLELSDDETLRKDHYRQPV